MRVCSQRILRLLPVLIFYFVIIFPFPHPKMQKGKISNQKVPGTYLGFCEKIMALVFNAAKVKKSFHPFILKQP